jgi:hypothetical protein
VYSTQWCTEYSYIINYSAVNIKVRAVQIERKLQGTVAGTVQIPTVTRCKLMCALCTLREGTKLVIWSP